MDKYESVAKKAVHIFSYNEKNGELVWRIGRREGVVAGTLNKYGYVVVSVDNKEFAAHRIVWLLRHGAWPDGDIDHINGVRSDNRIENLRIASRHENAQNRRKAGKNNHIGLLGVSRHVSGRENPYVARITVNRKRFHLGVFETAEQAHAAYVEAKRRLHPGNTL